ncbi:MAG TPA: maleylpyruvate isomerase family mycothiol-dependent enzyme [Acidimicrobiia bacterium]|nr:maleylpyruvate isomerase family mycothiol-dependent enzyme [Acidimicrobiia bacterium]
MNHGEYVDAIRRDGADLAVAAEQAGVGTVVPSCPLWTIADLLGHLGRIHRWVASLLAERAAERGAHWSESEPPPVGERIEWFAAGVPMLADALTDAGPDVEMWTWTSDRSSGFWARRQANETAVHRYDAQLAARAPQPVAHDLSVDGIDELFELVPFWPRADRVRGDGETLHFHCTDGTGEWLARLERDGLTVTREHAKGDVAARGTASDLLLFLYGRIPADRLEVFGDASLLARWRELVSW